MTTYALAASLLLAGPMTADTTAKPRAVTVITDSDAFVPGFSPFGPSMPPLDRI